MKTARCLTTHPPGVTDFTRRKKHDSYQKAFDGLLRDPRAEEKKA